MSLDDLSFAVDALKDRVCQLEQDDTNENILKEAHSVLAQCRNVLNQINAIKSNITRQEKRIEIALDEITRQHHAFGEVMERWADYFAIRRNINFRAERDGTKDRDRMTISESLNEIAVNLRRKQE